MTTIIFNDQRGVISDCGRYRPWLSRGDGSGGTIVFIMLNPSTADAEKDDPTIRRCLGFAKRENATKLIVVNLFTARATKPADLWQMDDPIGPQADHAIREALCATISPEMSAAFEAPVDRIICAWGAIPSGAPSWFKEMHNDRVAYVLDAAYKENRKTYALGYTASGAPRHPLYVRADAELVSAHSFAAA